MLSQVHYGQEGVVFYFDFCVCVLYCWLLLSPAYSIPLVMMVAFILKLMLFSLNNRGESVVACLGCAEEAWASGDSEEFCGVLPYWKGKRSQKPGPL